MIFCCCARRILIAAGVTLYVLSMANYAEATCGDWLAEPHSAMQESAGNDTHPTENDLKADAPDSNLPCHGPSCRKQPSQPAAPSPAPPNTSSRDLVAVAIQSIADSSDIHVSTLYEVEATVSQGHPPEIEHPPRV